jgi:hypothetical protein
VRGAPLDRVWKKTFDRFLIVDGFADRARALRASHDVWLIFVFNSKR